MNLTSKLTTMALAAGMVWADSAVPARSVTVCLHRTADTLTLYQAQAIASKMFATAGVAIDWHEPRSCPVGAILINLSESPAASDHPGALAYALPYQGTHIVVFYDRIRRKCSEASPSMLPMFLAHVLVHEITHVLQGVSRHSETGVMKACWDNQDFHQMWIKPLPFTALDIYLIDHGIDERNRKAVLVSERSESRGGSVVQ
jgi:hypothetical protein